MAPLPSEASAVAKAYCTNPFKGAVHVIKKISTTKLLLFVEAEAEKVKHRISEELDTNSGAHRHKQEKAPKPEISFRDLFFDLIFVVVCIKVYPAILQTLFICGATVLHMYIRCSHQAHGISCGLHHYSTNCAYVPCVHVVLGGLDTHEHPCGNVRRATRTLMCRVLLQSPWRGVYVIVMLGTMSVVASLSHTHTYYV